MGVGDELSSGSFSEVAISSTFEDRLGGEATCLRSSMPHLEQLELGSYPSIFSVTSQRWSGSLSPSRANSIIRLAITSLTMSGWSGRARQALSKAAPMARVPSGPKNTSGEKGTPNVIGRTRGKERAKQHHCISS